jgi:hypothetical protein
MEQTIYEMIKDFISTLGFPIFVAVWMLWRDSKRMEKLTEVIKELKLAIDLLIARAGS